MSGSKRFSLFVEALLVFEAQDPSVEWNTKVAVAVQNAILCYRVIYDKKKRATTQTSLDRFFRRVDRIESSKEPEPVLQHQAWVRLQLALHLLLLMVLQLYHLPPPSPPPVSNSSCLFTRCQPLYASCCTVLLYFSRQCTVRLKMFYFVFFMYWVGQKVRSGFSIRGYEKPEWTFWPTQYYFCEKFYKPITVQYHIANCVSWVPRLTLLDLWTNWTYECALGMELVHM